MIQRICPSALAFAVGLVLAGCSSDRFWAPPRPLAAFLPAKQASGQTKKKENRDVALSDKSTGATDPSALAMVRLAERRGQMDQAREFYQRLLEKDPNNPLLSHRLGVIHARQGRFEQADESFSRALALKPNAPEILCDLGYSYYLQHRLPEAQEVLERALESKPYDEAICNNLALVYGEQGRYDQCLAMFRRTCDDAEAYANLAFVYAQHGDLENAKAIYSRALTLDKNLRPAAEALVQLARLESRSRETISLSTPQPGGPGIGEPTRDRPQPMLGSWPAPPYPNSQIGQVSFQSEPPRADARLSDEVIIP